MKPEWINSRDMRRLSAGGVVLWWILISQADDEGRLHADVDDLANLAKPWMSPQETAEELAKMQRQRMTRQYSVRGEPYILLKNWPNHQKIDHPTPSRLPAPSNTKKAQTPRETFANDSRVSARAPADRKGSDLKGSDLPGDYVTNEGELGNGLSRIDRVSLGTLLENARANREAASAGEEAKQA